MHTAIIVISLLAILMISGNGIVLASHSSSKSSSSSPTVAHSDTTSMPHISTSSSSNTTPPSTPSNPPSTPSNPPSTTPSTIPSITTKPTTLPNIVAPPICTPPLTLDSNGNCVTSGSNIGSLPNSPFVCPGVGVTINLNDPNAVCPNSPSSSTTSTPSSSSGSHSGHSGSSAHTTTLKAGSYITACNLTSSNKTLVSQDLKARMSNITKITGLASNVTANTEYTCTLIVSNKVVK